ncbi:hypothetical protein GBF38_021660 [Nibea albiflora]|uniref:Uncharacterized protein n=1 Tax=Nibea albiflora TaxID=240163 RepID=A0ACB7FGF7_NIBAL|nr:hypothetical protein GBF38_021660 [Nibea albiflora]
MRYEHERHSVGPLPASDMRARICYRGAGLPNTACLPGRERGLTGGRRAAKSPPLTPSTPTTTHRHHYHHCPAKGTLDKQQSPLTSFHTDLIKLLVGCKGCLLVPVLAEESIMVMSVSVNVGTGRRYESPGVRGALENEQTAEHGEEWSGAGEERGDNTSASAPIHNSVTVMPTDGNFLWSCPVIGGETSKQRTAGWQWVVIAFAALAFAAEDDGGGQEEEGGGNQQEQAEASEDPHDLQEANI